MSLLPSGAARIPGPSRSLCALLALLLLTPPGPLASGESSQPAGRTGQSSGRGVPGAGKCPGPGLLENSSPSDVPYNVVSLSVTAGPSAVVVRELRCVCLTITPMINPKMISNLQMIAAGPQCPKVELM